MSITIKKLGGTLGAEIYDVDLSANLNKTKIADIREALLDNLVIFFRDQNLTDEDLVRVGKCFGELAPLPPHRQNPGSQPEILVVEKKPNDKLNFGYEWHSDTTHLPIPPLGSILYALKVPKYGGDTMFANQYTAYETLSDSVKETLDGMRAIHGNGRIMRTLEDKVSPVRGQEAVSATWSTDTSLHPIVRTHPETGKKALYVNIAHTQSIAGMEIDESQPLLQMLYEHSTQNHFTCRFQWEKGSVAFWDNRCCQHLALNDYPGEHRLMHRVQIKGTRPV
ncbi:MAG: taurine dioxygenase [Rhodospirillaceae bacterium]|nr:taurine dioxygenase [Rhodospirillaceae bacterium]